MAMAMFLLFESEVLGQAKNRTLLEKNHRQ